MDARLTPANARVAASHLRGLVDADRFVDGEAARIASSTVDLLRSPTGPRDRQLVYGDAVQVYDRHKGMCFLQCAKDGYVGYAPESSVGAADATTHWVAVASGHAYAEPDIKSPNVRRLYFGSRLNIVAHMPKFYETADGLYVPKPHLRSMDQSYSDPVTVAQLFFGAPYLWGGNTADGIDCSGLIQAAMLACDLPCPGDSDQQEADLGDPLPTDAPVERGDLFFWRGHVGLAVDASVLLHANAFHMAVAYEPLETATRRIDAQGDGPITSRRRVTRPRG